MKKKEKGEKEKRRKGEREKRRNGGMFYLEYLATA